MVASYSLLNNNYRNNNSSANLLQPGPLYTKGCTSCSSIILNSLAGHSRNCSANFSRLPGFRTSLRRSQPTIVLRPLPLMAQFTFGSAHSKGPFQSFSRAPSTIHVSLFSSTQGNPEASSLCSSVITSLRQAPLSITGVTRALNLPEAPSSHSF